jgi:hypothetical protein
MNDERSNDIPFPPKPFRPLEPDVRDIASKRLSERSQRRAAAINAVVMAREQGGHADHPWSNEESDIIVAIMDLLEKVAGA